MIKESQRPRCIDLPKIDTQDSNGRINGWLISLWKDWEDILRYPPRQIYLNCCRVGEAKGPHLHKIRSGSFVTISGTLLYVARYQEKYIEFLVEPKDGEGMKLIEIPAGVPCCIYNVGKEDALFLNLPRPAWHPDQPDDWHVDNWTYELER